MADTGQVISSAAEIYDEFFLPALFPTIRSWMHTDARGWTLAEKPDDAQFERLVSEAETEFSGFVEPDGSVRFAHPALFVSATKR